ncbi:MAG: phosphatidylserine decarboxylase family protein [Magnetococcus sp. DMHC-8]
MRSPVAAEGWPFIAIFVGIAVAGEIVCPSRIGSLLLWVLAGWCVWFFRDPERQPPPGTGLVIAPADGRVIAIEEVAHAPLSGQAARKCSIFMNVFSVHVNRCPISGQVTDLAYHPGRFFNAALDKASLENERMAILVTAPNGVALTFVQVAGLIARRIICRLQPGQTVTQGERFGLIRFGSRVDVYLPLSARLAVQLGDQTRAGETVMAHLETAP